MSADSFSVALTGCERKKDNAGFVNGLSEGHPLRNFAISSKKCQCPRPKIHKLNIMYNRHNLIVNCFLLVELFSCFLI